MTFVALKNTNRLNEIGQTQIMIESKFVIGIIPARGGSKGLKGKNIFPLSGKPLLAWTIEAAKRSTVLDDIVVSTDDVKIAAVAEQFGILVPLLRPPELAADESPTIDAVLHVLSVMYENYNKSFEYVCLLEPTSPLREVSDIDTMVRKLHDKREAFDAIISVGESHLHPLLMKRVIGDTVENYFLDQADNARRQDYEPAYFPFGVAYICKTETLWSERTFFPKRMTSFKIQRHQNFEIDDHVDLMCVEALMKNEG